MIGLAAILGLLCVISGVLMIRIGLLSFETGFSTFGLGLVGCTILAVTAAALIFRRLARKQPLTMLPLWLLLCSLPVVLVFNQLGLTGFRAPAIHDISTDLISPPVFVFAQAERGSRDNSLVHGGQLLAEQQRSAYPQLASLRLAANKADVWDAVMTVIAKNNWRLLGEDHNSGHIEAVARTALMNFADDIVIRIRANPVDSHNIGKEKPRSVSNVVVDVRSVSRVGVSDLGTNAVRIGNFLQDLKTLLNNQ